ncbi:OsmC family peroxiredoxin [Pyxidicoccus fallax]|uniref:OsmC family peroxiredoxin n=1 Tax=Pyxidicoccus fallax TaxID=394095 RepID=A0A848LKW4_9BACT|nr:OsmC family protein [Pyxidicoccus fallax]NMO18361.1 OsmC family peroxiredoxin [Pyxidicoccus fallax]NPC83387.1 OsmC family peroxiredoxin [Pyxidicoccus fallax]
MQEFPLRLRWEGSTASEYTRDAVASTEGKQDIAVSAASSYGGNDARWNPEDLFGASLATCHMLTFLSLAKKVRLDVRGYEDHTTVTIDTVEKVTRVTKVRLAPTIRVAPGTDVAKVREMFEKAHKYCFIGQSVTSEVLMEPTIEGA